MSKHSSHGPSPTGGGSSAGGGDGGGGAGGANAGKKRGVAASKPQESMDDVFSKKPLPGARMKLS